MTSSGDSLILGFRFKFSREKIRKEREREREREMAGTSIPFSRSRVVSVVMLLLAALLLGAAVVSNAESTDDDVPTLDRPFLVVDKVFPVKVGVEKSFPVTITVYNAGESSAFDVAVEDLTWSSGENAGMFKVKGGDEELSATFEKIEPQTNVTVTLDVRAKSSGSYVLAPSKVLYKGYSDDKRTTGYSAQPAKAIRVMSMIESQFDKIFGVFALVWKNDFFSGAGEWYYFAALSVLAAILYMSYNFYEQAKVARKTHVQMKYEKELLKTE